MGATWRARRVLVVGADPVTRGRVALAARSVGLETVAAGTLAEGLAMAGGPAPAAVLVSFDLSDGGCGPLVNRVRALPGAGPVAVLADGGACEPWPAGTRPDAVLPADRGAVADWLRAWGLAAETDG